MRCVHTARLAWMGMVVLVLSSGAPALGQAPASASARGSNIARGAACALSPAPNYDYCTDPGDVTQLTDGQLSEGGFWTQRGTVGWKNVKYATVTIDLGRTRPIAGVSLRTAAGRAGVGWPAVIRIHLSDDGKSFRDVGDLLALDESTRSLPADYAVRTLATKALKARARYVRLVVIPTGPYIFADEVEVFQGDESFPQLAPSSQADADVDSAYVQYRVQAGVRRRFNADVERLTQCIHESKLDAAGKDAMTSRLRAIAERLAAFSRETFAKSFKAILPFDEAHAELFALQAELWRMSGRPPFSAWAVCPWDPQDLFAPPHAAALQGMEVHTMLGEHRAAAFSLANASNAPMQVSFGLAGLPGGPAPKFVTAYQVPWTDTGGGQPVAAALVQLPVRGGTWAVQVPPGLTQQIWLSFHVAELPGGHYAGGVEMSVDGIKQSPLPLELHVYPVAFPARTTLWLGGWDYTDGKGAYGVTPANHKAFVDFLRDRLVNAPWATSQVMMKCSFENDRPVLDTALFDDWLAQWPDARAYLVFLSVDRAFAGMQMGTPAFDRRVGSWISAWVRHLAAKGITPERLGLLLVDEPRANEHDETIIAWAKAIHAAEPKVLIWEDPLYKNPKKARPEMFQLSDILCPNRPMWLEEGKPFADFYLDQQKQGRTLQFYSCSGPARLLDPYSYYRLQAWQCWQIKATGSFFWAFGDNNGASSWNEYTFTAGPFTPLFLDDESVTSAKQMEAIREGVEDYEYFIMLDRLVQRAAAEPQLCPALASAQELLQRLADQVLAADGANHLTWHAPKDRTRADAARVELLKALAELSASR